MKFDELAELYTSMSLRSLGFSLVGIFVPVYFYQNDVNIVSIFTFFGLFFILRIPISYVSGLIVGRIGPKHSIAVSTVLFIMFLGLLLSFTTIRWPLPILAVFYSMANGLFFIASETDFSKVKHKKHGGKELGWLFIFERAGGALGPIAGGLIASIFAPEFTIVFAVLVFIASLVPLFLTNEPVKLHQNVKFSGFPLRAHARDYVAVGSYSVVNLSNGLFWPFFIALVVFTDDTYAKLGGLVGLSLAVSMITANMFGRFIDSRKGHSLLTYGLIMNGFLNLIRSVVNSVGGVFAASVLGEPVSLSYRMPITKGYYDAADSEEGYRIVYLVWGEIWNGIAKSAYCFALAIGASFYDPVTVLRMSFILLAAIGFIMTAQRFPALKK